VIAASSGGGGGSAFFLIIIVAFAVLWLVVVRPQRKRQNQQKQLLDDLRVGDDVLTAGGIYGRVTRIDEDEVRVEVAPKTELRVARRAIAAILTEHEPEAAAEAKPDDGETWKSAFDEEPGGDGSGEENPG
jgi:preprotein translocase subunit YajC